MGDLEENISADEELAFFHRLRRCILTTLYTAFREHPYALVIPEDLEQTCRTESQTLNWNMVYLEKCGYVELGKSIQNPPYIASSIELTAAGIDLVEAEDQMDRQFPADAVFH